MTIQFPPLAESLFLIVALPFVTIVLLLALPFMIVTALVYSIGEKIGKEKT